MSLAAVACVELSSPTTDIESVSTIRAAYPAAVVGDTLRDSLGVARPLEMLAFTGEGDTVQSPEGLQFILPDSGVDARVENGFFIAGQSIGTVRVFGQVAGLQTTARPIEVVPQPDSARPTASAVGDTAIVAIVRYRPEQASVNSVGLEVRILGDTGGVPVSVNGWIVSYRIVRQPARNPLVGNGLPAFFPSTALRDTRTDSTVAADTTSGGTASRSISVRPAFLASFTAVDTVDVEATVLLRGSHVPGSPIRFRVPLAPAPAAQR